MASAIARVLAAISAFPAGRSAARVTMAAAASAATAVGRSCIRPPFRVPKLRPPKAMIVWPMRDWLRLNRPAAHVVDSLADARQDKQQHAALIDAKDDPLLCHASMRPIGSAATPSSKAATGPSGKAIL
jgi:hypothetical protein